VDRVTAFDRMVEVVGAAEESSAELESLAGVQSTLVVGPCPDGVTLLCSM